jgi:hypothetical protein
VAACPLGKARADSADITWIRRGSIRANVHIDLLLLLPFVFFAQKHSVTLLRYLPTWSAKEFARELDKAANILEVADDSERNPDCASSLGIDTMSKILLGET